MVAGYAIGGGHVLHVVCDLTVQQTMRSLDKSGPKSAHSMEGLASVTLHGSSDKKKAREIWFLCRQYDAQSALDMGLVNAVVPLEALEAETYQMVP